MEIKKIDSDQLQAELEQLPNWQIKDNKLYKSFIFSDFKAAWKFMSEVANLAETQSHHPDWRNIYNKVEITLSTDDIDAISQKDLVLAHAIEKALGDKNL